MSIPEVPRHRGEDVGDLFRPHDVKSIGAGATLFRRDLAGNTDSACLVKISDCDGRSLASEKVRDRLAHSGRAADHNRDFFFESHRHHSCGT